ncbi:MAG: sensor histidine kinase, partial [Chloroflexota bacterium]|nr:sensor histidine kinase [Chloroflexota bacterium]
LQHYAVRLQALSQRVVEVQETERKLLAAELHDSVVQWLSGTLFRVEAVRRLLARGDEMATAEELTEIERSLQQSIRELRTSIMRLHPTELKRRGLVLALQQYVNQWRDRTGIHSVFHAESVPGQLSMMVESALYRICQEALNNVEKHAQATEVVVAIKGTPKHITLTVRDNGVGMEMSKLQAAGEVFWYATEEDAPAKHIGLLAMCERAQIAGGKVTVDSRSGMGTSLVAAIPLDD